MTKTKALSILLGGIALLYPVLIYFGLQRFDTRMIAGILLALILIRAFVGKLASSNLGFISVSIIAIGIAISTLISGSSIHLKLYPVLINACLMTIFIYSVFKPPSIIEKIARLSEPDLPASGVAYTRNVTIVWSLFFLINGSIALATVFMNDEIWALYNGLIAYIAIGVLMGTEFIIRRRVKSKHQQCL